MNVLDVAKTFCEAAEAPLGDVLSKERRLDMWYVRYMLWMYLHCHKGYSAGKIARALNRKRRSVFRGIGLLKHGMRHDEALRDRYQAIVEKLEGADSAAPSEDME